MKHMKWAALLLAVCMVFAVFSGCTANKPAADDGTPADKPADDASEAPAEATGDEKVDLSVLAWMPEYPDLMDVWAEGFHEQYPNYTADIVLMADDTSMLQSKMAADDMPDAMSLTAGSFAWTVVDGGYARDLSDTASWQALLPAMQAEGTSPKGVAGVVPQGLCTTFIYYNVDAFKACGISEFPTNYEDFLAVCQTLKDGGYTPFSFSGADPNTISNTTWSYSLSNLLVKGDMAMQTAISNCSYEWDDASTAALADTYRRTVELTSLGFCNEGCQGTDGTTYLTLFVSGDAAMVFAGTWNAGNIFDGGANFEIACAPAPWNNKGEEMMGCVSGETGWGLGVTDDAAVDAAAVAWLDYMSIGAGYQEYQHTAGTCCMLTPEAIEANGLDLTIDERVVTTLNEIQSHTCSSMSYNYIPSVIGSVQKYFSEIMVGDLTPEEAAQSAINDMKNAA